MQILDKALAGLKCPPFANRDTRDFCEALFEGVSERCSEDRAV